MKQQNSIAALRHRVVLASMQDVVEQDGTMALSRKAVMSCYARIEPFRSRTSFLSPAGFSILNPTEQPSHLVTVRTGINVDFTSAAWVFEQRLKSPERVYKVLGFSESEDRKWTTLSVHLYEKSAQVSAPLQSDLQPVASKVLL
jgi:hypothetical protein